MELREKEAAALAQAYPSAGIGAPRRIGLAGRARPAMSKLPTTPVGGARPSRPRGVPSRDTTALPAELAGGPPADPAEAVPPELESSDGEATTTITPIRRQIVPS